MKITKEDIYKMHRIVNRNEEIQNGLRINHKRVHKSKKTYNRKNFKLNID